MVRAWAFDGFQPHWYHFACFFLKAQPSSLDQIDGVYSLRPDDQSKLKKKLGNVTGADGKGGAVLTNFVIQYAKSGKAKCRLCEEKIEKDEVRISKKEIDPERSFAGMIDRWYHVGCFLKARKMWTDWDLKWKINNFTGWQVISKSDQKIISEAFEKSDKKLAKKQVKTEAVSPEKKKKEDKAREKLEKHLATQAKIFWKTKDSLKGLSKQDVTDMLEHNKQDPPESGSTEKFLDRLVDGILFGRNERCKDCKGQLVPGTYGYKCTGYISGFTACTFTTVQPEKSLEKFKVGPEYLIKKHPILGKLKISDKTQYRVFPK